MNNGSLKISAIVPAYNEEERINKVLGAIKEAIIIDEIIVVDDGSTDKTSLQAEKHGVKIVKLANNQGKGAALQKGIKEVSQECDILIFIDADLIGLTPQHVHDLVDPLIKNPELAMTIGKFTGGRIRTDLAQFLIPNISGQRAIRKKIIDKVPDFSPEGFGAEVSITNYIKAQGAKYKEVLLYNVTHVMKEEKLGIAKGLVARVKMYNEMIKTFFKNKIRI